MTQEETFERLSSLSRELSSGCICNYPASDSQLFNDLSFYLLRPVLQQWIIAETNDGQLRSIPRVSVRDLPQTSSSSEIQTDPYCRTEFRDSLLVHLSTLAMFWDASHPQCHGISSLPAICGRIAAVRSRLLSCDILETLILLLHSKDQFVRAMVVRCISRICLDNSQEWKKTVQNLIDTLLNSEAVEMCSCILDVLVMILSHSHNSVHPHHQELAARPSSCDNIKPAKSVTCESVQKELASYLQTPWGLLVNVFLLKHLKNISDIDQPQHLRLENSELVSTSNENSIPISKDKSTVNPQILPIVPNRNLTVIISFLRLWKLLFDKQVREEESSVNCVFFSEKSTPCILHFLHNLPVFPSTVASIFLDILLRFVITPDFNSSFVCTAVTALAAENWLELLYINTSGSRGFGGPKLLCQDQDESERISPVFRKTCLLILKCLMTNSFKASSNTVSAHYNVVSKFLGYVSSIFGSEAWLIKLFGEHDDDLSDGLLSCLDLYLNIEKNSCSNSPRAISDCLSYLNPHVLWKNFVKSIAYDHQVILDILTSGDNSFLEYFIRYLKLLAADLSCAKETVSENETSLNQLMQYSSDEDQEDISGNEDDDSIDEPSDPRISTILIDTLPLLVAVQSSVTRLYEKELFPFNPTPLLRLLSRCCDSY